MKGLIVYSSKYGQTRKIANRIATRLVAMRVPVEVIDVSSINRSFSLARFDAIILGSPIYATRHSRKLGNFIRKNRNELSEKKTAFYSVSLSAAGRDDQRADASRCMDNFLAGLNWQPDDKAIFAGSVPYRDYNWLIRWLMIRMVRSGGGSTDTSTNHEYTNWESVDEFCDGFINSINNDSAATGDDSPDSAPPAQSAFSPTERAGIADKG